MCFQNLRARNSSNPSNRKMFLATSCSYCRATLATSDSTTHQQQKSAQNLLCYGIVIIKKRRRIQNDIISIRIGNNCDSTHKIFRFAYTGVYHLICSWHDRQRNAEGKNIAVLCANKRLSANELVSVVAVDG